VRDHLKAHVLISMDVELIPRIEVPADADPVIDKRAK
jgi:hypothetical protein